MAGADSDRRRASRDDAAVRKRLAAEGANPTVRQRELGRRLRELRNAHGMTVEYVAEQLLCSATKISRLETGARRASLRDVRDLARVYGVTDQAAVERLMDLARQAREAGWWTYYDDLALSPYIGLEQEAVAITSFSMYYVPPLLQTAAYARAIIKGIAPRLGARILSQRVEARMRRQQLLKRDTPPRYLALLDEAVLRRRVGGIAVMRSQLENVLRHVTDGTATVQVIPFDIGGYGGIDSNFDLLEFDPNSRLGPVVFVESLFTNLYQERPAEIVRYRESLELLCAAALSPDESAKLITCIQEKYAPALEITTEEVTNDPARASGPWRLRVAHGQAL